MKREHDLYDLDLMLDPNNLLLFEGEEENNANHFIVGADNIISPTIFDYIGHTNSNPPSINSQQLSYSSAIKPSTLPSLYSRPELIHKIKRDFSIPQNNASIQDTSLPPINQSQLFTLESRGCPPIGLPRSASDFYQNLEDNVHQHIANSGGTHLNLVPSINSFSSIDNLEALGLTQDQLGSMGLMPALAKDRSGKSLIVKIPYVLNHHQNFSNSNNPLNMLDPTNYLQINSADQHFVNYINSSYNSDHSSSLSNAEDTKDAKVFLGMDNQNDNRISLGTLVDDLNERKDMLDSSSNSRFSISPPDLIKPAYKLHKRKTLLQDDDPNSLANSANLPSSGSKCERKDKRLAHNAIEKKYRISINSKINELKSLVMSPRDLTNDNYANSNGSSASSKLNKSSILQKAVDAIRVLQRDNLSLKKEVSHLKRQLSALQQQQSNVNHNNDLAIGANVGIDGGINTNFVSLAQNGGVVDEPFMRSLLAKSIPENQNNNNKASSAQMVLLIPASNNVANNNISHSFQISNLPELGNFTDLSSLNNEEKNNLLNHLMVPQFNGNFASNDMLNRYVLLPNNYSGPQSLNRSTDNNSNNINNTNKIGIVSINNNVAPNPTLVRESVQLSSNCSNNNFLHRSLSVGDSNPNINTKINNAPVPITLLSNKILTAIKMKRNPSSHSAILTLHNSSSSSSLTSNTDGEGRIKHPSTPSDSKSAAVNVIASSSHPPPAYNENFSPDSTCKDEDQVTSVDGYSSSPVANDNYDPNIGDSLEFGQKLKRICLGLSDSSRFVLCCVSALALLFNPFKFLAPYLNTAGGERGGVGMVDTDSRLLGAIGINFKGRDIKSLSSKNSGSLEDNLLLEDQAFATVYASSLLPFFLNLVFSLALFLLVTFTSNETSFFKSKSNKGHPNYAKCKKSPKVLKSETSYDHGGREELSADPSSKSRDHFDFALANINRDLSNLGCRRLPRNAILGLSLSCCWQVCVLFINRLTSVIANFGQTSHSDTHLRKMTLLRKFADILVLEHRYQSTIIVRIKMYLWKLYFTLALYNVLNELSMTTSPICFSSSFDIFKSYLTLGLTYKISLPRWVWNSQRRKKKFLEWCLNRARDNLELTHDIRYAWLDSMVARHVFANIVETDMDDTFPEHLAEGVSVSDTLSRFARRIKAEILKSTFQIHLSPPINEVLVNLSLDHGKLADTQNFLSRTFKPVKSDSTLKTTRIMTKPKPKFCGDEIIVDILRQSACLDVERNLPHLLKHLLLLGGTRVSNNNAISNGALKTQRGMDHLMNSYRLDLAQNESYANVDNRLSHPCHHHYADIRHNAAPIFNFDCSRDKKCCDEPFGSQEKALLDLVGRDRYCRWWTTALIFSHLLEFECDLVTLTYLHDNLLQQYETTSKGLLTSALLNSLMGKFYIKIKTMSSKIPPRVNANATIFAPIMGMDLTQRVTALCESSQTSLETFLLSLKNDSKLRTKNLLCEYTCLLICDINLTVMEEIMMDNMENRVIRGEINRVVENFNVALQTFSNLDACTNDERNINMKLAYHKIMSLLLAVRFQNIKSDSFANRTEIIHFIQIYLGIKITLITSPDSVIAKGKNAGIEAIALDLKDHLVLQSEPEKIESPRPAEEDRKFFETKSQAKLVLRLFAPNLPFAFLFADHCSESDRRILVNRSIRTFKRYEE
ncbi:uncharacterized protein LOC135932075 isoform X2 [Gordionus sp. m RMFG-2023]